MSPQDVERIALAIAATPGFEGFALVVGVGDQTVVLLNNCCADDAAKLLVDAGASIQEGEQRPALFN